MATLFERLVGQNLPIGSTDPAEQKIAIHAYAGAIEEWAYGYLTPAEIVTMFSLDAGQQSATQVFIDLLNAAPNKQKYMRVFKNWIYLGETSSDARYLVQSNLVQRMQDEVTDQGGTLP